MATKTITIMEDAYELLKAAKEENESFSDTIRRTYSKKKSFEDYFGAWGEELGNEVEAAVNKMRTGRDKKVERIINDMP